MDALGCRSVMCSARDRGVLHWLAGMGGRDPRYRDADNAGDAKRNATSHWVEVDRNRSSLNPSVARFVIFKLNEEPSDAP